MGQPNSKGHEIFLVAGDWLYADTHQPVVGQDRFQTEAAILANVLEESEGENENGYQE